MTKRMLLFTFITLALISILLFWAPWTSAEKASTKVVSIFNTQWQDVADGCGFNCEGCGVIAARKLIIGYTVEIEYACGMLPADQPEFHQRDVFYVSPLGTTHKMAVAENDADSPPLTTLNGTEWTLVSINDERAVTGEVVILNFPNPNEISGYAGCNYYGGRYTSSGDTFTINEGRIDRTNFDCDVAESVIQQESTYFVALTNSGTYRATEVRLELTSTSGQGTLVFARKLPPQVDPALLNTEWILISMPGQLLRDQVNITLDFGAETAGGYTGCNNYGGTYKVASEGNFSMAEITRTAQDCETPEGVMAQEETYLVTFGDISQYQIMDNHLELFDASGTVRLIYERKVEFTMNPADLIDTAWSLTLLDGDVLTDEAMITIKFISNQELEGQAVCRDYTASYEAEGDDIRFPLLSMIGESCFDQPELLHQGGKYIDIFGRVINYKLSETQLEFISVRNEILMFEPLQTTQE